MLPLTAAAAWSISETNLMNNSVLILHKGRLEVELKVNKRLRLIPKRQREGEGSQPAAERLTSCLDRWFLITWPCWRDKTAPLCSCSVFPIWRFSSPEQFPLCLCLHRSSCLHFFYCFIGKIMNDDVFQWSHNSNIHIFCLFVKWFESDLKRSHFSTLTCL